MVALDGMSEFIAIFLLCAILNRKRRIDSCFVIFVFAFSFWQVSPKSIWVICRCDEKIHLKF
jgi:hypothetical protein